MNAEANPKLNTLSRELPACPLNKSDCELIAEIAELRQTLDELSALVQTDSLTGIANYRFFVQSLAQEMERTTRSGQPTTLIMLDIDHFKLVNDRWGHEIGNQALNHIAKMMQMTVRKLDIPCRYGGEEFAVILPNTDLGASIPVAERLRQLIAETPMPVGQRQLQLTASLGIDTFHAGQEANPEELVQRADHYLYQAKQEGRNQVRHASIPPIEIVSREERDALSALFGASSDKSNSTTSNHHPREKNLADSRDDESTQD